MSLPLTTYRKLSTEFYDFEEHRNNVQAVSFYLQQAQQAQGRILEPMCGSGRFLMPFLQAGYEIEGFDASEHMLAALKQKYATISTQPAPVWQQFVQEFSSDKRYSLIFVPYGSWGLITNLADAKKGLELMHHYLAPGGKFIVEIDTVASVPSLLGVWRRRVHHRVDGSQLALNILDSYEPTTQMFTALCRYESMVNGAVVEVEIEDFKQYLYQFDEMDQLLADAGFTQIKKYRDYAQRPASHDAHMIIYEV